MWGGSLDEMYPEIVRFMAARRLCPDTIRPAPSIRFKDGRIDQDIQNGVKNSNIAQLEVSYEAR